MDCLPDDLLIQILSHLSTIEAARTSILSSRWRHLWRLTGRLLLRISDRDDDEHRCAQTIDSILSSFQNPNFFPIRKFTLSIACYLTISSATAMERWIAFAIDVHNVQLFSINLFFHGESPLISFPLSSSCNRVNNLRRLKLSHCNILPAFENFRNLRSMSLHRCRVSEAAIDSINLSCTMLKRLSLSYIVHELRTLRVSSSLDRLKHLSIDRCSIDLRLLIEPPNLASLNFRGIYFNHKLGHRFRVPRLKQLTLSLGKVWHAYCFFTILQYSGAEKVDYLRVDLYKHEQCDHMYRSFLKNVTMLKLEGYSLSKLDPLLRACSSLKTLELALLGGSTENMDPTLLSLGSSGSGGIWKHENLEKIQISEFRCTPGHLRLFKYMVELAVGLKKTVLVPSKPHLRDEIEDDRSVEEYVEDVANMLLPQGAELVIKRARR